MPLLWNGTKEGGSEEGATSYGHMEAKKSPWWLQAQLDDWGSEMK